MSFEQMERGDDGKIEFKDIQTMEKLNRGGRLYDNRPAFVTLFQARTNSLPLQERIEFQVDTRCQLCSETTENLEYFCEGYNEERKKYVCFLLCTLHF